MHSFRILGGKPIHGTVTVSGAKNAALPMMAASILAGGPVRLQGVPRLADVDTLAKVLWELGMSVRHEADGALSLETVDTTPVRAGYRLVRSMRASFCVLGPLLARRRRAIVPLPGGCRIGPRPVDLHLKGLAALGADLKIAHGCVVARARRLVGTKVHLAGPNGPTVTGTANVIMAAVLARGETLIQDAAREPEIVDLGNFLNRLGARIDGLGASTLRIRGVEALSGASHRVIPDRIEAATLLLAAAITRGSATVEGAIAEHLAAVLEKLDAVGCRVAAEENRIRIAAGGPLRSAHVQALPYPGIPTDVQAQWMAFLATVPGRSTMSDHVFPGRFLHAAELTRLGARIELAPGVAIIDGVEHLTAAPVQASDLRASAALVLAGLAAEGRTTIGHIHHLDRGYERLDKKLALLGARIDRG